MPYCTLADIEKKRIPTDTLIQLTDDDNVGIIGEPVVAGCIDDATILVNGYLRGRYPIPLPDPAPGLIVTITADLASYGIYASKPQFDVPDTIKARRETAIALLIRIQDGKMQIYDETSTGAPAVNPSPAFVSGPDRLFSRETMKGL
ncbi:DUF1320 family protein [Geobacter pelophilus]|uniref:DUF1320 family protein n=1 Tax=Geoanaerobacter pelophilus TaxID=60036 RepID=A0AAW4L8Y6_9BACT|nr:DUF1320 domain-containing protein [Geoanaerobacter pelophilus]MBT0664776.1 DUF1320 family protein [Geoanaerobacter pelophilus]